MTIEEQRIFELAHVCLEITDTLSKLRSDQREFVLKFVEHRFAQLQPMPGSNGNGRKPIGRPPKIRES